VAQDDPGAAVFLMEGHLEPGGVSEAEELVQQGGDRTIMIPASCVEGLDKAQAAIQHAREGVDAIGGLDSERLQQSLDRLRTLQREITDLAVTCRSAATDGS
jgi:hypothetical protein